MQITRFRVQGYKNLTRPIELRELGSVVVIHGQNNVGKSNLLEAIELAFVLVGLYRGGSFIIGQPRSLDSDHMASLGYHPSEIFNFERPVPIRLELVLRLSMNVLQSEILSIPSDTDQISLVFEISPGPPQPSWQFSSIGLNGVEIDDATSKETLSGVKQLLFLLARNATPGSSHPRRFQLLSPDRAQGTGRRGAVPDSLMLALYDAQESTHQHVYDRWRLFSEMLAGFEDILGAREVRAVYDRKAERATLVLQKERSRVPVHLLGTGVQQLVILLGTLATSGASIAAIEEPEANLSFFLQRRLRDLLRDLPSLSNGPSQIFFTSHSPGFQIGPDFHVLEPADGGPTLKTLPADEAASVTGVRSAPSPAGSAPYSWVTRDGLVCVPPEILAGMGLSEGGGVSFLEDDRGGYRLVTDDQALRELGWGEE